MACSRGYVTHVSAHVGNGRTSNAETNISAVDVARVKLPKQSLPGGVWRHARPDVIEQQRCEVMVTLTILAASARGPLRVMWLAGTAAGTRRRQRRQLCLASSWQRKRSRPQRMTPGKRMYTQLRACKRGSARYYWIRATNCLVEAASLQAPLRNPAWPSTCVASAGREPYFCARNNLSGMHV